MASEVPAADIDDPSPQMYAPLLADEFRVFELLPGSGKNVIRGTLSSRRVSAPENAYMALSYAWGDAPKTECITCANQPLLVSTTIHDTLVHLRQPARIVTIWVDALCINQGKSSEALRERDLQVAMMSRIFASAGMVLVVLGSEYAKFDLLIKMFTLYWSADSDTEYDQINDDIHLPGTDTLDWSYTPLWQQLTSFLELPWFTRLWCFQEYTFANHCVCLLGSTMISHSIILVGAARAIYRMRFALMAFPEVSLALVMPKPDTMDLSTVRFRLLCRQAYRDGNDAMFGTIWASTLLQNVTDPRDRLYALYATLPPNVKDGLRIDYAENLQDLQQRFSIHLIERDMGSFVLMYAVGHESASPSWHMSLRSPSIQTLSSHQQAICSNVSGNFGYNTESFRAGGKLSLSIRCRSQELLILGSLVDTLTTLSPALPPDIANGQVSIIDSETLQKLVRQLLELVTWSQQMQFPPEHVCRVLTFDCYDERIFCTPATREHFVQNKIRPALEMILQSSMETPVEERMNLGLFSATTIRCMKGMRLSATKSARLAAVPQSAEPNDVIAVFEGVPAPFVLRPAGKAYRLIGPCYLYGAMEGELISDKSWSSHEITIV